MDGRALLAGRAGGWARCRAMLRRYAVTWLFLAGFGVAWAVSVALPASRQSALLWWASTDVENLRHDPEGSLVASAFLPDGGFLTWVPLIALAMFGANRALGNARTALVVVAGQVIGTLVSEGIVAYRIGHGLLPAADDRIMDVGPSYVIVSAIVVAVLFGTWPARVAAGVCFVLLVLAGDIFGGLSTLQVAAVGHVTAIAVSLLLAPLLMRARARAAPGAAPVSAPARD